MELTTSLECTTASRHLSTGRRCRATGDRTTVRSAVQSTIADSKTTASSRLAMSDHPVSHLASPAFSLLLLSCSSSQWGSCSMKPLNVSLELLTPARDRPRPLSDNFNGGRVSAEPGSRLPQSVAVHCTNSLVSKLKGRAWNRHRTSPDRDVALYSVSAYTLI